MGWVEVEGDPPAEATEADFVWEKAKTLLSESDWAVLPDVPMTVGERQKWVLYRQKLRDIRNSSGFPYTIDWPVAPE